MNQLHLLRDYVTTMEKEIQSKNFQLKTLREENDKLIRENQQLCMKKSNVTTYSVCEECPRTKRQLSDMQSLCQQLQLKYDQLQKQRNTLSSSVRVLSTNCSDCSRVKRDYDDLKIRYDDFQRSEASRVNSNTKYYTQSTCNDCPRLRTEIKNKDDTILTLRADASNLNAKILALEGQILTLNATSSRSVVYTHNVSRPNDLQRISYLNGQVEQYLALVNSLRSEIKILNQDNQRYVYRIREMESRPREVQLVEKQFSPQIRQQMRALKIEIGELSNDNIVLRRQNANLKRQIMNLQKTNTIIIEKPPQSFSLINEERPGKHFRKSTIINRNHEINISQENLPFPQKVKYENLQRRIQMLQIENDYLKGTFYSEI